MLPTYLPCQISVFCCTPTLTIRRACPARTRAMLACAAARLRAFAHAAHYAPRASRQRARHARILPRRCAPSAPLCRRQRVLASNYICRGPNRLKVSTPRSPTHVSQCIAHGLPTPASAYTPLSSRTNGNLPAYTQGRILGGASRSLRYPETAHLYLYFAACLFPARSGTPTESLR